MIREKYKDYLVLRSFTSQMVIKILKKRDNIHVFNPEEAIEEMKKQGIEDIYIQPLHIIPGYEYEKLTKLGAKVGLPLLSREEDMVKIIEDKSINDLGDNDALIFMGHGTGHDVDKIYGKLEKTYHEKGYTNVFIGTVEGSKTIEDIVQDLKTKAIKKVKLKPFMLVAGDHARNDMASDDEDSWKSILEKECFQVEVKLEGLGEQKTVQEIFINHLEQILEGKQ